jgi:hypothetical protein
MTVSWKPNSVKFKLSDYEIYIRWIILAKVVKFTEDGRQRAEDGRQRIK